MIVLETAHRGHAGDVGLAVAVAHRHLSRIRYSSPLRPSPPTYARNMQGGSASWLFWFWICQDLVLLFTRLTNPNLPEKK
jgi:hypothetical protein